MKNLSKTHQITLVCEKRDYQTQKDVDEVTNVCKEVITVKRKKQWSLDNILKTGFSFSSFLIAGHTSPEMKQKIKNLLEKEKFDLIHIETSYIMQNLPETSLPIVLVEHNIEYMVYKRYSNTAPFFARPLLNIDILKLKRQEEKFWEKANFLVAVSEEEKNLMQPKNENTAVVPNGVDLEKFKVISSDLETGGEKTILYIGDFKWVQNRDAIKWIIEKIWPSIKLKVKSEKLKVKLWVVGKNIHNDIKKLAGSDIFFDENAPDDTSLIFQKVDLLLSPIRVGGGSSYKILEAMASGVPVVTTRLGAGPLGAVEDKEIIVSENEKEIADQIIKLVTDEEFYKKISANARQLVEQKYDWKKVTKKLEDVYRIVLRS
ncbi:MAG: glycosyltransferase family 4 protein [Candidatus Levybacteria bacterium]|nr:glycosyltransferase family 4 protein [Candidatus Levybacteria bacterium]